MAWINKNHNRNNIANVSHADLSSLTRRYSRVGTHAHLSHVWYRSQVVEIKDRNYRVRFIDFGNSEIVRPDEFVEGPDFFHQLAPQAICCRLGTRDHVWGKQSQNAMKKLTLSKQLQCTVLVVHLGHNML